MSAILVPVLIGLGVIVGIVGLCVLLIWPLLAWAQKLPLDRWVALKGFAVPVIIPLAVAIAAGFFTSMNQYQREANEDNQKSAELLRQIISSHDRPDIAYLTAVGDRFVLHLRRYQNLCKDKCKDKNDTQFKYTEFDEYAAYFFYGMFRVGLVHFYATKGYALYPRLWMEQAFDAMANQIIEEVQGVKETHPEVCLAEEEAALYKYFRPIYQTSKQEQTTKQDREELGDRRVLLTFHTWLNDKKTDPLKEKLQAGFKRFRNKLHTPPPVGMNVKRLIQIFEAITGLDDYAFNEVFAGWYSYNEGVKGAELTGEKAIPTTISRDAPKTFLFYPLPNFEGDDWEQERKDAWKIVYSQVFTTFGGSRPIPRALPISPEKEDKVCPES